MFSIAVFLFLFVTTNFAEVIITDNSTLENYSTEQKYPLEKIVDSSTGIENDVTFHLLNNANGETGFLLNPKDLKNITESPFNPEWSTKVFVHGWTGSMDIDWYTTLRKNYFKTGNYNIICVDWSVAARKEYFTSARLTQLVGEYLGKLLTSLETNGNASLSNFHIIGHSLGAHVAGIAGSHISGRVGRITGMDPARPAFEIPFLVDPKNRLDSTDAKFVDVIHTCAGTLGIVLPVGHADFYVNGGSFPQPGCMPLIPQICSHSRVYELMAESIVRPKGFLSFRCNSWLEFISDSCNAEDEVAFMGEMVSHDTRGSYYLRTNFQPPFGMNNEN